MKPRSAQLKQQQALNRRAKLEESAARAQQEDMFGRHNAMRNYPMAPPSRFAFTNRVERRRDPNRGIITQSEWNELVEQHEDSGKAFRYFFALLILAAVIFLSFTKYDEEFNLEVPQIESGVGFGEIPAEEAPSSSPDHGVPTQNLADLEEYYKVLGVEDRLKTQTDETVRASAAAAGIDPDKERRRENRRVRQKLKEAYDRHNEQRGQLVHCGRSCEQSNQQVQIAYNRLASVVDRELFGVLLDAKDTKSVRATSPAELKKKYEEKKAKIMETETDEEDREMALEELKDAYDIIVDDSARKYYLLYGAKPPEHMRHVSARHGGWGQEMALGTYKYRIIIMWLDFLHDKIGVWGETIVLLSVVVFILSRLPAALKQSERLLNDLEWQEQIREGKAEGVKNEGGEGEERK